MKYVTVSRELEKEIRDKMEATLEICRKHYNKPLPTPPLKFIQLGRRAGVCHSKINRLTGAITYSEIRINPDFFKNYHEDMINNTVPHEVAHYVSIMIYGRQGSGHGWLWREVMNVVGVPAADRCHQYDMEGVKVRAGKETPFKYSCRCENPHMMTRTTHQRHQASVAIGGKGYKCTTCRQFLIYQGFMNGNVFVPKTKEVTVKELIPARLFPKIEIAPLPTVVPKPVVQPTHRTITRFVNGVLTNIRVPLTEAA